MALVICVHKSEKPHTKCFFSFFQSKLQSKLLIFISIGYRKGIKSGVGKHQLILVVRAKQIEIDVYKCKCIGMNIVTEAYLKGNSSTFKPGMYVCIFGWVTDSYLPKVRIGPVNIFSL